MGMTRVALVMAAIAAACGKGESQSLYEAAQILCASDEEAGVTSLAPAERQAAKSRWIEARLKRPEVRMAFAEMAVVRPAERTRMLIDLVEKAQLKRCDLLERATGGVIPPDLPLPELGVAAAGAVALDGAEMLTVVARSSELVIEGTPVVPLHGMLPDEKQLRTALSYEIVKLRELTAALVAQSQASGRSVPGALLLLRPDAPYKLLVHLVMSMKPAGVRRFHIVARRDGEPVAVPVELPEEKPPRPAHEPAEEPPLGLVVAMSKRDLIVFSMSGREGTLQAPRLATGGISSAEIARVQEALVDIHARHDEERRILLVFDATTSMQHVTETLAAVRARPDGGPLFTDVMLGTGFE